MNPEASTTWVQVSGVVALALGLVLVPGWFLGRALGLSRLDRCGTAGPLGFAVFLVAGLTADLVGISWSPVLGACCIAAVGAVAVVLARLLRGAQRLDAPTISSGSWVGFGIGVGAAAVGTAWKLMAGMGGPERISQEVDAQFHLQAATLLVSENSATPLGSGEVFFYGPIFYPGGLHSLAATLTSWTGADVVIATHVVLLVCAAVLWPLGLVVLVARTVSVNAWVLVSAGLLALTAVYAPIAMLSIGGAWANLVSASLVPGALIPLGLLLAADTPPKARVAVVACAAAAIGTGAAVMAQPSAFFSVSLLVMALAGPAVVRWGRGWVLAYACGVALLALAWVVPVNDEMVSFPISADPSTRRAILVLLKNGQVPLWSGAVVAALTLAGVVAGLRRGRLAAGIAAAWLLTAALAASLQFASVLPVQRATWPWFSAYARIASMVVMCIVLVGCLAVAAAVTWGERRSAVAGASIGAMAVACLALAAMPAVAAGESLVRASYDPQPRLRFVSDREVVELHDLADTLSASDTVALDPFRGGVFIALFGPRVVPVGPYFARTPEIELVSTGLDRAGTDPDVCAAARELGVTHVLVGGGRMEPYTEAPTFPGIDAVPGSPGFRLVATDGDYELYELPSSCVT